MLWYKSWLETRWRFLLGLAMLMCSAAGVVLTRPEVMKLMPMADRLPVAGEIGRRIREAVDLSRSYNGYVWSQWFRQNGAQFGTIFAALLGTGGLLAQSSGGAALFTLSMPVTRARLLGIRAAAGLAEWFVLAFAPSLLIPLLSPTIGESYGVGNTLVHSACLFIAGAAFFSLAFLLSTAFGDIWRPLLLALLIATVLAVLPLVLRGMGSWNIFNVMSGESYFRGGRLPWAGLTASAAASAAMLYAGARNIAHRDF
ncbi:MAG TPA: hypothetical protein VGF59_03595 [Bryobacteraceae bacterium]